MIKSRSGKVMGYWTDWGIFYTVRHMRWLRKGGYAGRPCAMRSRRNPIQA